MGNHSGQTCQGLCRVYGIENHALTCERQAQRGIAFWRCQPEPRSEIAVLHEHVLRTDGHTQLEQLGRRASQ